MITVPESRAGRLVVISFAACALVACGPSDDKGKEKKVETPPPAKVPAPAPKPTPTPKPAPAPKPAAGPKPAAQLPGGFVLLGYAQAGQKTERDKIAVGGKQGQFKELRITVAGGSVAIDEVIVTFGNGEEFRPKIQHQFTEQSSTRNIDLPGNLRNIRSIEFVYRATGRGAGTPTVAAYGR